MGAEKGNAASKFDDLKKEFERVTQLPKAGGISSVFITKETLDKLKEDAKKASSEAAKKRTPATLAYAAYTTAAQRDAEFCCRGRKWCRATALQSKLRATYGRALVMKKIEKAKEG